MAPPLGAEIVRTDARYKNDCADPLEKVVMKLTSQAGFSSIRLLGALSTLLLLGASTEPALATEISRGGVMVRNGVSINAKQDLVRKLKSITGWHDLDFDRSGFLRVNPTNVRGGSPSARELLRNAVSGENLIVLEGGNSRSDVIFCRVDLGHWIQSDRTHPTTYLVLIDFNDFKYVSGDREARAAFDVGWAVLHELEHVVNYSEDTTVDGTSGDCEAQVNLMRTELGLPTRASYYFTLMPLKTDLHFISKFVRLPFEKKDPASEKLRRYWLIWDAVLVGGLATDAQTASLRSSFRLRK